MNIGNKINHTIDAEITITKYAHDTTEVYELDTETAWVNEILEELHDQLDPEDVYPAGALNINLEITRKKSTFLGDHVIVKAHVDAHYHLPCGITLQPLAQHMDLSVNAAFIHDSQEKQPEYVESTTVFAENEEMELYFYRKGKLDIKEFLHEQIFLEVPAFPRAEGATSISNIEE